MTGIFDIVCFMNELTLLVYCYIVVLLFYGLFSYSSCYWVLDLHILDLGKNRNKLQIKVFFVVIRSDGDAVMTFGMNTSKYPSTSATGPFLILEIDTLIFKWRPS